MGIFSADLNGLNGGTVARNVSFVNTSGLAIDAEYGTVYWSGTDTIERIKLNGSGRQTVVTLSGTGNSISGIFVDGPTGKLYWTENTSSGKAIKRTDLDGQNIEEVATGSEQMTGVTVDTAGGRAYWTARFSQASARRICRPVHRMSRLWCQTPPTPAPTTPWPT